jgi:hypothetical protein
MTPAPVSGVFRLSLNPSVRMLAACTRRAHEIFLWDVGSGALVARLPDDSESPVCELLFVGDGNRLLVIRDQADRTAPPIVGWDISLATGPFPALSKREIAKVAGELIDERLGAIADMLDAKPPLQLSASALSELKRSLRVRPPRGFARTRDGAMIVLAQGDGSLNVYRTATGWLLASCHVGIDGTTTVLRDPTKREKESQPQDRERPEWMARRLVQRGPKQQPESDLVVRLDWFDKFAFSVDGRRLAVWREEQDQLTVIDLTTGRADKRYNLGRIDGQNVICFTAGGATLALGGFDHVVRLGIWLRPVIPSYWQDTHRKKHGRSHSRPMVKRWPPRVTTAASSSGMWRRRESETCCADTMRW